VHYCPGKFENALDPPLPGLRPDLSLQGRGEKGAKIHLSPGGRGRAEGPGEGDLKATNWL